MARITNEVLATKIDNINNNLDNHIKDSNETINTVKSEVKINTEFRLKATGTMTTLGAIMGFVGASVFWILNRFWGGGKA